MFAMVACDEKAEEVVIPEGFTEEEYEKSLRALEIIEEFLNAEIDGEDAVDKLDIIYAQLSESESAKVSIVCGNVRFASQHIERISLGIYNTDSEDLAKIKEYRDNIKEYTE